MTTLVGHAQEVDQRRHDDEAAADAEQRAEDADAEAERDDRDDADVEHRALEAHLERQAVKPGVLAGPAQRRRPAGARVEDGADRLGQHQSADRAEEGDVGERDDEVELAEAAQRIEDDDADDGADDAGEQQHGGELHVDQVAAPVGERPRRRGRDDLRGDGRHRDDRRNAGEDEERREQEAAADAEQPRQESDGAAHAEDDEHVHRDFGYGQVNQHGGRLVERDWERATLRRVRWNCGG